MAVISQEGLKRLSDEQAPASDPVRNIWLSASAGTGKTQVLAARVFRLLLRGTDPAAILCLTFTKAGAAEMAARISGRLAQWVRMDQEGLSSDLRALGENPDDLELQHRARTLFAKVLDAPGGGIRIQTIHSFCQTLLAAFPVEAGLVPGFRPLDAREEQGLAREALAQMLVDAEREGRAGPIDAIGALSLRLGEGAAEGFLQQCARAPDALEALPSGIPPWLRRQLDLPEGDIAAEVARCCADAAFDLAALRRIAAANRAWGGVKGASYATIIETWLVADVDDRVLSLQQLREVFHTQKGELRKSSPKQLDADADYDRLAEALGSRCAELLAMQKQAEYADLLARALEAGREYARTYTAAKRRTGAVDFDDLIRATVSLLDQPGMGDWIRYKLDQATEHVLIDESQDTNLNQWKIIDAVVDDFFSGEGVRGAGERTLFAVGDYKQAIFGFQGTDPIFFRWAFERFSAKLHPIARASVRVSELEELSLTHSFRTTEPVLEFVDAALAELPEPGMGTLSEPEPHVSKVPGPGTVTLWPPITVGGDPEDEEGWIDDATRELAKRIARQIRDWLAEGLTLDSKGRKLRPEDVMILVKRRGELASLIVARLYAEGVPVAGVDRLRLNAPLAVQDLLTAIRFALQPEDDLALASLLVSPLIGWSQDELMHAAVGRRTGLWRHLRATQAERIGPLEELLRRADFTTPYRFLEELLSGPLQGRRKLLLRLGEEARDPTEELLNAALNFESVATPSLQRFLDWFDRGDVDIVRDAAQPQGSVRVMTAHGAKGLQAPLVILADATTDPTLAPRDTLLWHPEGDGTKFPIFRPRAAERAAPLASAVAEQQARELEEHWRLFYVAATRAEERLVIAGALGPRAKGLPPEASWYAAAARALDALGVERGEGNRSFHGLAAHAPVAPRSPEMEAAPVSTDLPDWLRRAPPPEARPPRPLAPSSLGEDMVADPPPNPAMRAAAERGRLLHALFERLPAVASERRAAAAERWLAEGGGVVDPSVRSELASAALAVIEDPRFADLFGPKALAEAPIVAVVDGVVVSGTVDRLVVTPDRVRVVDFKTGRRAPPSLADVPAYHLRQMAAYAAALQVIFPDHAIDAALLYSAGPTMHVLPPDLVAEHKPGFSGTEQSLASRA